MASLGLCVISESYDKNVRRIINDYGQYFDEIYIQINGGGNVPKSKPHIHFSKFKWVDDFSKARNALMAKVKTDYWMWLDTDDIIINPGFLSTLIDLMEKDNVSAVLLPYNYDISSTGEVISIFWRERLFKTSGSFKWQNPVHETLVQDIDAAKVKAIRTDAMAIQHQQRDVGATRRSAERNLRILKRMPQTKENKATIIYYLANCYGILNDIPQSIKHYKQLINVKGYDDLVYDSMLRLGITYLTINQLQQASDILKKAIKLKPEWPDAYIILGTSIAQANPQDAREGISLLEKGVKKEPRFSLLPLNPQVTSYRPYFTLAIAYFNIGEFKKAKHYASKVRKYNVQDEMVERILELIETSFNDQEKLKEVIDKVSSIKDKKELQKLLNGQPDVIIHHPNLRPALLKAYKPKVWPKNSIVFVCYRSAELWGPDTLSKGIGGSEEAVIYLTAALAKLGWDVTVFSQRSGSLTYKNVRWLPLEKLRPIDKFNVFVVWRDLVILSTLSVDAKIKAIDLHDVTNPSWPPELYDLADLVFFKSLFHRAVAPSLPAHKAMVISNGIEPSQFKKRDIVRIPHKVIYASSPDRGLDLLLELWPQIREAVPDAELVWAYGWESFDLINQNSIPKQNWKKRVEQMLVQPGVRTLGRLDHQKLAEEFMSCSVWAYPTNFTEINCITALKAQAAGAEPITSGFAALQETVFSKAEAFINDIEINEAEKRIFSERLIRALKNPMPKSERDLISGQALNLYNWAFIASKWSRILKESLRYN